MFSFLKDVSMARSRAQNWRNASHTLVDKQGYSPRMDCERPPSTVRSRPIHPQSRGQGSLASLATGVFKLERHSDTYYDGNNSRSSCIYDVERAGERRYGLLHGRQLTTGQQVPTTLWSTIQTFAGYLIFIMMTGLACGI